MFQEIYDSYDKGVYGKLAMEYLVEDTLVKPVRGKSKQFTAMDMESKFSGVVYPSMIYTFMYDTDTKERTGSLDFIDYVPCMMCMTNDATSITGLNFNLLPINVRISVLDFIYNSYKGFYTKTLSDAVVSGTAVLNEKLASFLVRDDTRNALLKYLDDMTGVKVSGAYRMYKKEHIKNIRLIEYDAWKYIPFLLFKDAVRGAGLASVQASIVNKDR